MQCIKSELVEIELNHDLKQNIFYIAHLCGYHRHKLTPEWQKNVQRTRVKILIENWLSVNYMKTYIENYLNKQTKSCPKLTRPYK